MTRPISTTIPVAIPSCGKPTEQEYVVEIRAWNSMRIIKVICINEKLQNELLTFICILV